MQEEIYVLNMRLPKDLIDKVKEIAKSKSISLSAQVRLALIDLIEKQ